MASSSSSSSSSSTVDSFTRPVALLRLLVAGLGLLVVYLVGITGFTLSVVALLVPHSARKSVNKPSSARSTSPPSSSSRRSSTIRRSPSPLEALHPSVVPLSPPSADASLVPSLARSATETTTLVSESDSDGLSSSSGATSALSTSSMSSLESRRSLNRQSLPPPPRRTSSTSSCDSSVHKVHFSQDHSWTSKPQVRSPSRISFDSARQALHVPFPTRSRSPDVKSPLVSTIAFLTRSPSTCTSRETTPELDLSPILLSGAPHHQRKRSLTDRIFRRARRAVSEILESPDEGFETSSSSSASLRLGKQDVKPSASSSGLGLGLGFAVNAPKQQQAKMRRSASEQTPSPAPKRTSYTYGQLDRHRTMSLVRREREDAERKALAARYDLFTPHGAGGDIDISGHSRLDINQFQ